MHSRAILAGLLLLIAAPVFAEPAAFEKRVVGILNAGGTSDAMEARLNRVGTDPNLTPDQRVAIDALRTLVRSRNKPGGLSIAEAQAFAARNPASPASALLLAEAALAGNDAQRSADLLIAASRQAGPLVQLVSPATVSKVTSKLDRLADKERTAALAKALLEAGWSRGSASLRSYLALAAIRDEIAHAQADRARRFLPAVRNPASLHLILIDNRLAALRPDVERIAGPRLERAWTQFLTKARDEWLEHGDALSAIAYAEALKQANQYEALADAFMLRFVRGYNCPSDLAARSVGPDLAESLAKTGRWTRAEDIMRRSGGVSPPVYAAMLLERGEFGQAVAILDRSLKAADPPVDKDEQAAIAWLQAARQCAAHRGGGHAAASSYDPGLLDVSARLFVLLCTDRDSEARAALTAALADEEERSDALRWVQPFRDPDSPSRFRQQMNAKIRSLQRDPAVLAAVSQHGVILDWALTSAAPSASALPAGKSAAPWHCGDQPELRDRPYEPESMRLPDSQP